MGSSLGGEQAKGRTDANSSNTSVSEHWATVAKVEYSALGHKGHGHGGQVGGGLAGGRLESWLGEEEAVLP